MTRKLSTALLLGAVCLTTACATTAKGVSQSSFSKNSAKQTLKAKAPEGTILAVVRYPAFVDEKAKDAYYKAYTGSAIGGSIRGSYVANSPEVQALADGVVLKSNYFALSLFKELAAKLPPHSVLLSPHKVELGADGKLTSTPMTQAESLPNVVSVDFASYSFPDPKKMMDKEPLTFGDIVTPLVSVRTDHLAAAPTHGLLMASNKILPRSAGNGFTAVKDNMSSMQNGNLDAGIPELDFIAHLKGETALSVPSSPVGSRKPNAVSSYPIEKIKLDGDKIKAMNAKSGGSIDPLSAAFTKSFANQIVGIINDLDMDKATRAGRAAAIAQFDESLAALTLVGGEEADYQARLRYAERLLQAVQKYLSVQSLRLFDGVHNSEMGAQVRDMIKAEHRILEERRKLAKQQNVATALAVLAAVGAGVTISNQDDRQTTGQRIAINAMIQGAIFAAQQAYSKNQQSKYVGNNYLSSIIPALDEQTTVQVNLIDSNETITAIRFEDLKAKLQTLYSEKQRSLDTVATRCSYTHQGTSKTGTWLGACNGGVADGAGVGVMRNADGSAVEYYGFAKNGQPYGAGYMISHSVNGNTQALEGNFTAGFADGAMRVSKAGQGDVMRQYNGGKDIGAASGAGVSPFTVMASNAVLTQ